PRATLWATDISRPALAVASRNAARLGMAGRVTFVESDLLTCFLAARASEPAGCGETLPNAVIPSPSPCHSERSEESLHFAQGELREESRLASQDLRDSSSPAAPRIDEQSRRSWLASQDLRDSRTCEIPRRLRLLGLTS